MKNAITALLALAVIVALAMLWAVGWLAYLVAFLAAAIFGASLWDFGMATTGHYCARMARPAAWWSIWSGLVLAAVILVWF